MAYDPDFSYHNLTPDLRQAVLERDNYSCRDCGKQGKLGSRAGDLQVHHVVRKILTNDNGIDNLVTLCTSCHGKREDYRGRPKRSGILTRVPCRFENAEQYRQVIAALTIDQRGNVLTAAARPARPQKAAKQKEQTK